MSDQEDSSAFPHELRCPSWPPPLALSACGTRGRMATPGRPAPPRRRSRSVSLLLIGDLSALGKGIQHSVELAGPAGQRGERHPRLGDQGRARRRRGQGRRRQERRDEARRGRRGRRCRRQPQLERVPADPAGLRGREHRPDLARNTGPSLTRAQTWKSRPYKSFFRTCTTDIIQGAFAAKFLLDQGIKSVATIHDKKTYGQGLVTYFTEAFKAGGGTIVAAETINPDESSYGPVVFKVAPAKPGGLLRR